MNRGVWWLVRCHENVYHQCRFTWKQGVNSLMKAQQIINRLSAHYLKEGYSQNLRVPTINWLRNNNCKYMHLHCKYGYNCPVIEQSILRDVDGRKAVMTMCWGRLIVRSRFCIVFRFLEVSYRLTSSSQSHHPAKKLIDRIVMAIKILAAIRE